MAYRELLLRQRINEGAAACMLSHATGDDLDNIAQSGHRTPGDHRSNRHH
jgi:phage-related baseplate assembly protein